MPENGECQYALRRARQEKCLRPALGFPSLVLIFYFILQLEASRPAFPRVWDGRSVTVQGTAQRTGLVGDDCITDFFHKPPGMQVENQVSCLDSTSEWHYDIGQLEHEAAQPKERSPTEGGRCWLQQTCR